MGFEIPNFAEQQLVTKSLVVVSEHISASMDKLLLWVLTGFGGGLTYLLGKTSTPLSDPKALWLYIFLAGCAAIASRYFASVVGISSAVFQKAANDKADPPVDPARFLQIYIANIPALYCWAAAYGAKQIMAGNLTGTGKLLFRMMLLQSIFGLLSVGLLGVGLYRAW